MKNFAFFLKRARVLRRTALLITAALCMSVTFASCASMLGLDSAYDKKTVKETLKDGAGTQQPSNDGSAAGTIQ